MRTPAVIATVIVTVSGASVFATGCSLQTAGAPKGGENLSATFDDVQSLVVGHGVQVSDVRIGTVTRIRLAGYRAQVTMSLQKGRRLPVGTTATIAKTSLLGENYVRLNLPAGRGMSTGPFLPDHAAITQTSVAPDLEEITTQVGPLLAALGGQDVSTIVGTSAATVNGKGEQLNRLIARVSTVSDSYAAASRDLGTALDQLAKLGRSLEAGKEDIDRLPGNVALATQRLKDDRGRLKEGIQGLLDLGRSFNARIQERHAPRLAALLKRTNALLASAVRGKEDLKTLATEVLTFLRSPRVTYEGQVLLYFWVKGFLPSSGAQNAQTPPAKNAGPNAGPSAQPRPSNILPDLDHLVGPR
ncbi:MCE family protein [Actinomadura barringtoniae]|uniref:MCE family protein n=1 Tax=Actinomadura barringtoniae TaxID=1427535 RepID=A0A939P8W5_9ACTN|nr:MCE family protein [Actinomadura barringtoniae]MBO2447587.1 MCE family protein [Actinomadura barringtoniae]